MNDESVDTPVTRAEPLQVRVKASHQHGKAELKADITVAATPEQMRERLRLSVVIETDE